MSHDVFISYTSADKKVADAVCARLESQRVRCWIAPRDILPGTEYGEAIVTAIQECRLFVLVFSAEANDSPQVRREVERAVSKRKIIVPFRIADIVPAKALEYSLSNTHWLDAINPPLDARVGELAQAVQHLLEFEAAGAGAARAPRREAPPEAARPDRQVVPGDADDLRQQVAALEKEAAGPDSAALVKSLRKLAGLLQRQGKLVEAEG